MDLMKGGFVEDGATYTLSALADALGYRQSRSLKRLLNQAGVPIVVLGRKKLVSGKQFRLAMEKQRCFATSSDGH